jgi:hypothetical protein
MTTNPLALRRTTSFEHFSGPLYGTPEWCDWRNNTMERQDIEWTTDGKGGAFLRHRQDYSVALTRELETKAERDRQAFNHRQRYPAGMNAAA